MAKAPTGPAEEQLHVSPGLADVLAELVFILAGLGGASRAAIVRLDKAGKYVDVVAHTLGRHHRYDASRAILNVSEDNPVLIFDEQEYAVKLANHPLREFAPTVKSLAVFWICENNIERWTMSIGNPSPAFFREDLSHSQVERLAKVIAKLIALDRNLTASAELARVEANNGKIQHAGEPDVALRLLLDTLVEKPLLRNRGQVAYIASRTWRKDLKEYQIRALVTVKAHGAEVAARFIAGELSKVVTRTFGRKFESVVPVPCGSSGRSNCLSYEIGREMARLLDVRFEPILVSDGAKPGSSHPAKNVALKPYKLTSVPSGNVLLVDDVASSGRHLELAYTVLSNSGANVNTAVWIAG